MKTNDVEERAVNERNVRIRGVPHVALGAILLLAGNAFVPGAAAQGSDAPPQARQETSARMIDEVIVTARRREERLVDTPIAVSAMSGEDLRERGVLDIEQLAAYLPSVWISEGQNNQIYIRGVGERTGFARIDPTVGVYLDDLIIPRNDGALLDTVDVADVQVLRGPQGTLFGKNTTGGAIVMTLEKPNAERSGYLEGGVGSFNRRRVRGSLNLPVTDRFYTRMTTNFIEDEGFLRDVSGQRSDSTGRHSFLLQSRWDASDDLRLDTLALYSRVRERAPGLNCDIVNEEAQMPGGLFLFPGDTDAGDARAFRDNCERNSRAFLGDRRTDLGTTNRNLDRDIETVHFGLTGQWHYHRDHSLKLVAGFRDSTQGAALSGDQDGGPANFQEAHQPVDSNRRSQSLELQLSGSLANDRINYTAGLFGMRERNDEVFLLTTSLVGLDLGALGVEAFPVTLVGPILASPRLESEFDLESSSWAAYFQSSFDITERLQLTLGLRHTEETRESKLLTHDTDRTAVGERIAEHPEFSVLPQAVIDLLGDLDPSIIDLEAFGLEGLDVSELDLSAFERMLQGVTVFSGDIADDPVGIAAAQFPDQSGDGIDEFPMSGDPLADRRKETFRETTPMASLSYRLPHEWIDPLRFDDAMIYFAYSEGFKSGFFEPRQVDGLQRVEPETLVNREVGLKVDAFEHRLRFSAALYAMRFRNMQLVQVQTDSENNLAVVFDNAGRSEIRGAELELTWLPVPEAAFNLSYSANDYEFKEFNDVELTAKAFFDQDVIVDRSDEPFLLAPETQLSAGFQYAWETDIGTFVPRIDVTHQSEIFLGLDRGSFEAFQREMTLAGEEPYTLIDLRLSWRNPGGKALLSLYARNVTDKRYRVGAASVGDSTGTFGQVYGDPRRVGIGVRWRL